MEQYSPALKAKITRNVKRLAAAGEIDPPILPYLRAINKVPGIVTLWSCWGHHEKFSMPQIWRGNYDGFFRASGYIVLLCEPGLHAFLFDFLTRMLKRIFVIEISEHNCCNSLNGKMCPTINVHFAGGNDYAPMVLGTLGYLLRKGSAIYRQSLLVAENRDEWLEGRIYEELVKNF